VETETVPHQEALVGERRSEIEVGETREKTRFSAPEQGKYDTKDQIERKDSPWAGKKSRYSTSEDAYRSKVATRFQDKIGDASPVSRKVTPVVEKRTTFDKINRFAFRKNADQAISVTRAGDELPAGDASGESSLGTALQKAR
jgi:hypothetical protein